MPQKIEELRDRIKRTKAATIGISESNLDGIVLDSKIYIENYEILRSDRIGTEEVLLVTLEMTLAINRILSCQMKLKISHLIFWCHTRNRSKLEFTDPQISQNS